MSGTVIRASRLSKEVRSGDAPLKILDDVSFEIASGATVAIVGASGSGKTTLLGLLAGLDRPTTGEVWLGDTALNGLTQLVKCEPELMQAFCVVFGMNEAELLVVQEDLLTGFDFRLCYLR